MTAFDALAPYVAAVDRAQAALTAHNRDGDACPLDGLPIAGRVIRHQQAALEAALHALRYAQLGTENPETLKMQGRLNRLAVVG